MTSLGLAGEAEIFASLPFYPMFSGVPNGPLRLSPPQVHAAVHNSGDIRDWEKVAAILHEALLQIDQALSQANVPISARKLKAFDVVRDTMLEVSDYKAFLLSEAHGRILIVIENWYRGRYGDAVDDDEDGVFVSMLLVRGTPLRHAGAQGF